MTDDVEGKRIRICIDTADRVVAGEVQRLTVPVETKLSLLAYVEGFSFGCRDDEFHVIVEALGAELRPRHPVHHAHRQVFACHCQASHVRRDVRDVRDFHLAQDDRQYLHGPGSSRHGFSSEGLLTDETSRPGVRHFKQACQPPEAYDCSHRLKGQPNLSRRRSTSGSIQNRLRPPSPPEGAEAALRWAQRLPDRPDRQIKSGRAIARVATAGA